MNPLQQLQRQAEQQLLAEALVGIVLLILFVWSIVWTIGVVRRWERRHEAQVKALQRIAANLTKETPRREAPDELWSDTSRG